MRNLFYIALCLILLPAISFAQTEKPGTAQHFIYLKNGKLLTQDEFEVKSGLFGDRFRHLNGDKIKLQEIKFYDIGDGYYAFSDFHSRFALRQAAGTFDLYVLIQHDSYMSGNQVIHNSTKYYLYNQGFEDLKQFNYKNLKADLGVFPNNDHPQEEKTILDLLEKGKKRQKTKTIVLLAGLSGFIAGTALYAGGNRVDDNGVFQQRSKGLSIAGLSLSVGGLITSVTAIVMPHGRKFYIEAFRTYNRYY